MDVGMPNTATGWDDLGDSRAEVPEHVVHRSFVSETVLLNLQTGQYHGMDSVGGRFFEVLSDTPSLQSAATLLAEEFAQPVERIRDDLVQYCSELKERGLLELVPQADERLAS